MVMGRIKRLYPTKMLSDAREAYASRGASGAAGSVAASIGSSPFKLLAEGIKRPTSMFWKGLTANKTILGINVGIGSFLKQSQVFTAAISSILQVVGALVDVFIAPFFIPLILPLIKKMSGAIPKVRAFAQDLAERTIPQIKDAVNSIWNGEGGWLGKVGESVKEIAKIFWRETGLEAWWETETNPFIVSLKYFFRMVGNLIDLYKAIRDFPATFIKMGRSALDIASKGVQTIFAPLILSPEEMANRALEGPFNNNIPANIINHSTDGLLSKLTSAYNDLRSMFNIGSYED
jgi:hypothetical protein